MALNHNPATDTYTVNSVDADQEEIEVTVKPGHFDSSKRRTFKKKVFPDSGASICLGGTQHLNQFGILIQELIPCNKRIAVVGGATLPCLGYINVEFIIKMYCLNNEVNVFIFFENLIFELNKHGILQFNHFD